MIDTELLEILEKGSLELGVGLSDAQLKAFLKYLRELQAWNKKINLTSITGEKDIIIKHFLDSLTSVRFLSGVDTLLDIGSGGGFPGLPLKIALPSLNITMMDSVEKKVHFIRHMIRILDLKGAEAISGRVESPELIYRLSGAFDCVTSRAFAELEAFVALGTPYVKPGGMLLAMKGPSVEEEIAAMGAVAGFSAPDVHEIEVPFSGRRMSLVKMRKG
ncbi:Ribosomal RNA small subunit methyltransferase G [uncultured bacterium]|nr:Ribosomal RNA small subunit methyltransferase G [uncultured bacterium]